MSTARHGVLRADMLELARVLDIPFPDDKPIVTLFALCIRRARELTEKCTPPPAASQVLRMPRKR
jgi:hypothetical protein